MTFSHTCSVFNALQLTGMVRRYSVRVKTHVLSDQSVHLRIHIAV
jgi:hypothetical protein